MTRVRGNDEKCGGVSRRSIVIGGGAGVGLLIAWALWPRSYSPNLNAAEGEHVMNAFLKIGRDGQVVVIVPQAELGQGVYTVLPQILADELGADWRTVAVQPAPISPIYANTLLAGEWLGNDMPTLMGRAGDWAVRQYAIRNSVMLTGGSTSLRMFAGSYREAGAAARVLLCKAAAARWDVDWEACDTKDGFVVLGDQKLRFGELAAEAAEYDAPDLLPLRPKSDDDLVGRDLPRLDVPSKIDGSANYAADVRLPGMVFASIRQGPIGNATLKSFNEAEAKKVAGFLKVIKQERWVAVTGSNWWAANKALDLLDPLFTMEGRLIDNSFIEQSLEAALDGGEGERFVHEGDLEAIFDGAQIVASEYQVAPALHLAMEPMAATAHVHDGEAEVWIATQAPAFTRAAVARALGLSEKEVVVYPMLAGGSFGRKMEAEAAAQAAVISREMNRPVQLLWSRAEDIIHDRPRPPAHARMAAKLGRGGFIEGWSAKVAAPSTLTETWARMADGVLPHEARARGGRTAERAAISGLVPAYSMGALAVDHYPVDVGLPSGRWRSNADHYSAFFNECFIDELAKISGVEPMSFRMQMLSNNPRLAHCLSTAAALGGWQGGIAGSGQGIACHSMSGSHIAIVVEASLAANRLSVGRIVAAVDCGMHVNPDIARQQIEGGLIFGLTSALGGVTPYRRGMPRKMRLGDLNLPRLADVGEITVEFIRSREDAGGVGEVGVPAMAPAIANALFTVTGERFRTLPLLGK
ncbi:xanthine dehydrogenase family protein molybdopterin-binding subunit [Rhizorhapis suberifaciens]|uniref:Isoquinoline 1-oxidoreductase beta subunit n=1 Tax=Rhizorhapis suberifaciens TaxID=13656 RepID=A0A840HU13_9SPHN|nr:molybdopterin cofactor-binding domain-containing protein [Rhizorhapis suberifaciens]MBB4641191.1 isoquinoline 1-oxidoreductase beta subunit [Rhizorhapis suberifaciens]